MADSAPAQNYTRVTTLRVLIVFLSASLHKPLLWLGFGVYIKKMSLWRF